MNHIDVMSRHLRSIILSVGVSLPARLVLFALVLVAPIWWFSAIQYRAVEKTVQATQTEELGLEFITRAIAVLEASGQFDQNPTVQARANVDAAVVRFERYAASMYGIPGADASARRVRAAWDRARVAPLGAATGEFGDAILITVSDISDASRLAFESEVDVNDLGDAYDNTFILQFQRLSVAYRTAASDLARGHPSVADRIAMAGYLAGAQSVSAPLALDMVGAFGQDASIRMRLDSRWHNAEGAAYSLAQPLAELTRSGSIGPSLSPGLAQRHGRLVRTTIAFLDAVKAELRILLDGRVERLTKLRMRIVGEGILAVLLSFGMVALLGRMVQRRDRRELVRAQQETRALSAELARQRAERALLLTEAQFQAVFQRSRMGIALLDRGGRTIESNAALGAMLGDVDGGLVAPGDPEFAALVEGRQPMYHREGHLTRADGSSMWTETTISPVEVPQPESVAAIAMVQDITERKAVDERLRHAATHDALTALPNRAEFIRALNETLDSDGASGAYAVLFIDLDDFKLVNDSLGHITGDRVLAVSARRIRSASPAGSVVARFHGDEFVLLLRGCGDASTPRAVAERIQAALRAPIPVDGSPVFVNSSVGIVLGRPSYVDAEDILRDADAAMYHAKSLGGSRSVTFDVEIYRKLANRIRIVTELRQGLERGEFHVAYQPVVDLANGSVVGLEALLRWEHPEHGTISPTEFIPIAEESNAIMDLGRFVLREACAMLGRLDAVRPGGPPLRMSVNLSVTQLAQVGIVEDVRRALRDAGLGADRLLLEITESGLLETGHNATLVLADLKNLGVRLIVDDFGTGYSSLRYLHELPIDMLKIDRTFVHGADGGLANEPIVVMLLTLAESLNITVIAEGIETEIQRLKLLGAGCPYGQGFLFSPPLAEANLAEWLAGAQLRDRRRLRIAT